MTIGQLAKKVNIKVETIRYYERIKLIPKPIIINSKYRNYTYEYINILNYIKKAKELGFTLKQIGELLKYDKCEDFYELTLHKLKETETKLEYYTQLKKKLKS